MAPGLLHLYEVQLPLDGSVDTVLANYFETIQLRRVKLPLLTHFILIAVKMGCISLWCANANTKGTLGNSHFAFLYYGKGIALHTVMKLCISTVPFVANQTKVPD